MLIKSFDTHFVSFSLDSTILSMADWVMVRLPRESPPDSCDLCCLSVADLDISETELPAPPDSDPHGPELQAFTAEAKLNPQTVTRQDGENGDGVEENIVYLWLYCRYFSNQNRTLAFAGRISFFFSWCLCDCVQIALRVIVNISCKFPFGAWV